jgi:hypothetical protein
MAYFLDTELAELVNSEQGGSGGGRTFTATAVRTNKYGGKCPCGKWVPAGQGSLTKEGGAWVTRHLDCRS